MSTSTLQYIKKKATGLLENRLFKTGTVLDVRKWNNAAIIEADLHLPASAMEDWSTVQYIKCKVAEFTYRDYTPTGWDAETHTCTLIIDAAHEGPGSNWAKNLKRNDTITYAGASSTRHSPAPTSAVVCLGDESSLGHLLALQQLTMPLTRFTGAVLMNNQQQCSEFNTYFRSPLTAVERCNTAGHHTLVQWLLQQTYNLQQTTFYIVGNSGMVVQLRKLLRQQGFGGPQIKAHGFWS